MNHFLLAGFLSACTLAAQSEPGTGSIQGHVLNLLSSAPVRKASVTLTAPRIQLIAETDAAGKFQFTGLPPGSYTLTASRSGFLDRTARRPVSLGQDGHVTNAEILLPPQGVIAGHVMDEDGDAAGGATVSIFKQVYRDGRRQWERLNTNTFTDETGAYRYPNLKPGRYLVYAWSQRPIVNNQYADRNLPEVAKMTYAPVYFPSALKEEAASPVEVGVGAEVRGIDIRLIKVAIPPRFQVRGKVIGVQDPRMIISAGLTPADGGGYGGSATLRPPDYGFEVSVPAGRYTILAHVYSGGPEAYATGSVIVTGNVTGVVLTMSRPPDITGRVTVAESGSNVSLQGVRVTLKYLGSAGSLFVSEARPDPSGKLVFAKALPPGHYAVDVNVRSLPDGCFIQKVKLGGDEVSADDVEITGSAAIDIVISHAAGQITGSVTDEEGRPFSKSSVTLIPADGKSRPMKEPVYETGSFKFTALRPGKYQLFAWEEVDDDLWQDPEFRAKYEKRATEITVGPSETQNVQLRAIAAEEMK